MERTPSRALRLVLAVLALLLALPAAASSRAVLTVDNDRPEAVSLWLDGAVLGSVGPRAVRSYRLRPGRHALRALGRDGRVLLARDLVLRPAEATLVSLEVEPARLRVRNPTGGVVRLAVDGGGPRTLRPGESRTLELAPGRHAVRVTASLFGRERTLLARAVDLAEGRERTVVVAEPTRTLVRVVNDTGRAATLLVDGASRDRLAAGASALVEVPVGRVRLALEARGRTLAARTLAVGPFDERTWVARPAEGALVFRSDAAAPLVLLLDGREVGRLDPWDDLRLAARPGAHTWEARDRRGRFVDGGRVSVAAGGTAAVRVAGDEHRRPGEVAEEDHDESPVTVVVSIDLGRLDLGGSELALAW